MFLKNLFGLKKENTLLDGYIDISNDSNIIITNRNSKLDDRELILLGLLIYGRILRHIPSNNRSSLIDLFTEIHSNYHLYTSKEEFFKEKKSFFKVLCYSNFTTSKIKLKYKKVEEGNYYIYLGVLGKDEFEICTYITFFYLLENVTEKNILKIYEAFSLISIMYKLNNFSIKSAVDIPNEIIFDTIPFD